jgi:PrgI family protein
MPADVDAPDKVLYGLTFRQIAILAVAAVVFYGAWRTLHRLLPVPVLLGAGIVLGALAFGLVVGRRDGLPLDRWLWHAVAHSRTPKALSTVDTITRVPDWVDQPRQRVALPAPLRLPATAIDDGGQITLGAGSQTGRQAGRAAMVAATTVNLGLRTGEEQAALIDH